MMVKEVHADKANKLNPLQWVNVYYMMLSDKAIFHSSCQVKDLQLDNPEDYVLRLTKQGGDLN